MSREAVGAEPATGTEDRAPARRSFLGALLALGASGVGALLAIPLARLSLSPLWRTTSEVLWSDIGPIDELVSTTTPTSLVVTIEQRDGWRRMVSTKPVYVVATADGRARVLSSVCSHLGCTIGWSASQEQFVCPCHQGIFARDGSLISGPPPRGMDELESVVEEGRLKVRYQYFRQLVPTREVIG